MRSVLPRWAHSSSTPCLEPHSREERVRTALNAGTVAAARLLGIDNRTGRLEPGYEADFLVLSANPLEDLTALDRPLLIVSDGVLVVDRR